MKILHLSIIIIFSLIISSCKDIIDSEGAVKKTQLTILDTNKPKQIKPLSMGNTWFYRIQTWDSIGANHIETETQEQIIKATLINNDVWYASDNLGTYWESEQPDGLHLLNYSDSLKSWVYMLEAVYPAVIGTHFSSRSIEWTVKSLNERVEVPAGDFLCIWYQSTIPYYQILTENIYYCPNVGEIKYEVYINLPKNTQIIELKELTSYSIKKY